MLTMPDDYEDFDDGLVCAVCGYSECFCEPDTCWRCGGNGWISVCMDDLCHGEDGCIHGDGNAHCEECDGEGETFPNRVTVEKYSQLKKDAEASRAPPTSEAVGIRTEDTL